MDVAERDIPEIMAALMAFTADLEPYTIGFDPLLDLRAVAAEVRLFGQPSEVVRPQTSRTHHAQDANMEAA